MKDKSGVGCGVNISFGGRTERASRRIRWDKYRCLFQELENKGNKLLS